MYSGAFQTLRRFERVNENKKYVIVIIFTTLDLLQLKNKRERVDQRQTLILFE